MTTYYYHGARSNLKMDPEESDSSSSYEESKDMDSSMIQEDSLNGFVGTKDKDIPYEQIIDHYDLNLEFQRLKQEQYNKDESEIAISVYCNRSPMFKVWSEPLPISIKTGIILKWLYLGKSAKNEAEDRKL